MNVLIVEDEQGAAKNLQAVLEEINNNIDIMATIESVQETVNWINNNPTPDLGFFDIQLADGNSFEIFKKVRIDFPIIFTTAFDQYAIQAFKVNSIDYLLKPIKKKDLEFALDKYQNLYKDKEAQYFDNLFRLVSKFGLNKKIKTKKTFLIQFQDKLIPIATSDFAYFYIQHDTVYGMTFKKDKYVIDQKLENIEDQINAKEFFRCNRQYIVSRKAIKEATYYFNGRLLIKTNPQSTHEILISKAKSTEFKNWLVM
jgi:two-component system LytT family response regulator